MWCDVHSTAAAAGQVDLTTARTAASSLWAHSFAVIGAERRTNDKRLRFRGFDRWHVTNAARAIAAAEPVVERGQRSQCRRRRCRRRRHDLLSELMTC